MWEDAAMGELDPPENTRERQEEWVGPHVLVASF